MIKKIIWLFVSSLMALTLVLASCGEAEEEEEEEEVVIPPEEEEEVVVTPEAPKYGGLLTIATDVDPSTLDDAAGGSPENGGGRWRSSVRPCRAPGHRPRLSR